VTIGRQRGYVDGSGDVKMQYKAVGEVPTYRAERGILRLRLLFRKQVGHCLDEARSTKSD
jgi:hypothetical protein